MNEQGLQDLMNRSASEQTKLFDTKGADYAEGYEEAVGATEVDRLANFKLVASLLKGAPLDATTVCAVYWIKHVTAILKGVRDRRVDSEELLGRFFDERNYSLLLEANLTETNPELVPPVEVVDQAPVTPIKDSLRTHASLLEKTYASLLENQMDSLSPGWRNTSERRTPGKAGDC